MWGPLPSFACSAPTQAPSPPAAADPCPLGSALTLLPLCCVSPSCSFHLGCPAPFSLPPGTKTDVLSPALTSAAELSHPPLSTAEA